MSQRHSVLVTAMRGNFGHECSFNDWYDTDDRCGVRTLSKLREVLAYLGVGPECISSQHIHVGSERNGDSYTCTFTCTGQWYTPTDWPNAANSQRNVSSEFLESDGFGR